MKKIKVKLSDRCYDIVIGSGAFSRLPVLLNKRKDPGPVVVVSDTTVMSKLEKIIDPHIKKISGEVIFVTVPPKERSKSIKIYRDTVQEIAKKTSKHKPLIVALGGGVVGDLAGFIAATYRRGVDIIQVPTTLLAQVDSSIGGKVGIDIPEAKNILGAFKQPVGVLADTDLLRTLPKRQIRNGLGEVVKYAVISKGILADLIENNMEDIMGLENSVIEDVIYECVLIKSKVVEMDEFDSKDIRIILNFGHTLGHAVEAACGYSNKYNHGESIALGMLIAGEIALMMKKISSRDLAMLRSLVQKAGLPVKIEGVPLAGIFSSYLHDKKFVGGSNKFVLPREIGSVEIVRNVPEKMIKKAVMAYVG